MSAKEFVDALQNKKNLDAEDAFKMAMSSKVGDAFEKTIKEISKRYRVSEKELMGYFEKEMLTI